MENLKPTIFFLTSRFPFPLEKGDKLRAYHQIKHLSKSYRVILCSLTFFDVKQDWKNELEDYCEEIHVFKLNKIKAYFNTFKMFFTGKPFQVGYFYQSAVNSKINRLIQEKKVDYIYCQLIRCAEYVKNIHSKPKIIDFMDTLSMGMIRRSEISTGLKKLAYKTEGNRLKEYENKIFDYFDQHTIISEQDRNFINHPLNKNITVVENGIDEYFFNYDSKSIQKKYDLVFVGNLSYPPNVECCLYIANEIIPYFESKGKQVSVLLSGANPAIKVTKLNENCNITVGGWVDDIRESYCQGTIFIAPLFIGTGLQNKLLEAMALGIPCITTNLANKALGAINNESVLIANDIEAFYEQINSLIENKSDQTQLIINAKKFVMANYSWTNSINKIPFIPLNG